MTELHNIPPVFDSDSRILILGSFPSVKSREARFFYGHPQNRFWRVIAAVCGCSVPVTISDKREVLLKNHIALWDVIKSCDISGSSDASIKSAEVNDFGIILSRADIRAVFANGRAAYELYCRHIGKDIVYMPSTSPANASWSMERLTEKWSEIKAFL